MQLWAEALEERMGTHNPKRPNKESSELLQAANAHRARQAVQNVQYKKAIQALTSSGLAQVSEEVYHEMLAKLPQVDSPSIASSPVPSVCSMEEGEVLRALRSFPNGTAHGPSGLRANHLKEAVLCPSPDHASLALRAVTGLVNALCSGQASMKVIPHLSGANLLASKKKGGGLCPIAVGEVIWRLVSKCVSWAEQTTAPDILTPLQLGVGVPARCEAIVHAVSNIQEDPTIQNEC